MSEGIFQGAVAPVSSSEIHYCTRAKYYVQADGTRRLAAVQTMSRPVFRLPGFEEIKKPTDKAGYRALFERLDKAADEEEQAANVERATRRARINVFDILMCNPDLDTFCTFTYSPEKVDRFSYEECYGALRPWLSNRVQRRGLKYVIVYEYHPSSGALHFHSVMNSTALDLVRARSKSGRAMSREGMPLYNIRDWPLGWTTAQIIGKADEDHTKVSKYLFKYMGKQQVKIGGRYALHGGELARPVYEYGETAAEFMPLDNRPVYTKEVEILGGSVHYLEHTFI